MIKRFFFLSVLLTTFILNSNAQSNDPNFWIGKDTVRVITTAMPFLTITPDARGGSLGDAGVASSPDANSIYWNPAKLAFMEEGKGFAISYNPWLRKLINDMSLSYLTGYYKLSKQEAVGIQLLYFDLGSIQFTTDQGNPAGEFSPQEYAVGATYSRKLSDNLGVALNLKYIHSNLSGNVNLSNGASTKAANAGAGDIGVYYKKDIFLSAKPYNLALGGTISNIGNKVSYTNNDIRNFIPTNLRLGAGFTVPFDDYNKITFLLDANKLMVPTPPLRDVNGKVIDGTDDKSKSLISGMFGSFADAPNGFKEEMKEFMFSAGAEYWYGKIFAVRGGFFHENKFKGNRRYFTMGFGMRYKVFGLDFAYLVPLKQNNPLAETLRFTLHFNFADKTLAQNESITE
jgi:hypothetical protein